MSLILRGYGQAGRLILRGYGRVIEAIIRLVSQIFMWLGIKSQIADTSTINLSTAVETIVFKPSVIDDGLIFLRGSIDSLIAIKSIMAESFILNSELFEE